jgi:hypothetical protein
VFAVQNDGERFGLPLCALGSGAVHGLCVVALLPLIMLSDPSDGGTQPDALTIEVEVVTASLPSVPTPRPSISLRTPSPPSREESGIEFVRQALDTDSAELTGRTSALPEPTQENALVVPDWPPAAQGLESGHEPPPSVTNTGQPDAMPPQSAELEIGLPADAAKLEDKPEETSADGPAADVLQPETSVRSEPEPKVARTKEEPAKPETLSAAKPPTTAKPSTAAKAAVAKPKPAARRTKVQRRVVQNPGKPTSGLQNLFKTLGKSRPNSKPKQAKSGGGTGPRSAPASKSAPAFKSAPIGKTNDANPLYYR